MLTRFPTRDHYIWFCNLKVNVMQKVSPENNSRKVLAIVLIVFGLLLILKKSGVFFFNPFIHFDGAFAPIRIAFHNLGNVLFSWPIILILVGLVLMAGRRSGGVILLVIGGVFLIPKLFFLTGAAMLLLFPLILIGLGIALVARFL